MKRKRALEEVSDEKKKPKLIATHEKSQESKSYRKKGAKAALSNSHENTESMKKKRKLKSDIDQNGEANEAALLEGNPNNDQIKKKKNGVKTRGPSDSPSDLESLGDLARKGKQLKRKQLIEEDPVPSEAEVSTALPKKKKVSKKAALALSDIPEAPREDSNKKQGVLKSQSKKAQLVEVHENNAESTITDTSSRKPKKKVRIDETEGLRVKKEIADAEPHFSTKELPAKIIKSKSNKNLTEEVKVSPLTVQNSKKDKQLKKINSKADPSDENYKVLSDRSRYGLEEYQEPDHKENGIKQEQGTTSEESDLEVFYINKNAEKEARKKLVVQKGSISMPKEDQLVLVQRIQEIIPPNDTKNFKYRLHNLEWQKIAFKNYTIEECQKVWAQLFKKVRHYRLLTEIANDVKQVIEGNDLAELKKSKTSKKKHPEMPKRPLSSYFLFFIRKRDKISKERPELDTVELNKFISEKYQNLPLEKKQKYEQLSAKNREEYKRQLEEFYTRHPEMRKIKKERKERRQKEKPPTRPDIPYKLFMKSELSREEIAEEDKAEFKEVCREKWRQMSDAKKVVWINVAEEQHRKYEEELKEYMAKHPGYTPKKSSHKSILNRQELNLKEKLAGKPKKPPSSAYSLFISMTLQSNEIADIPCKERWNFTAARWKRMTDEERDQYKQLLTHVHEQYQKDFKAYLDSLPEDQRQKELLENLPKKRKNAASAPSTSGAKSKSTPTKTQPSRSKTGKHKIENPTPPPRSAYKYFVEKYEGENPKEAWKSLSAEEKEKYESELSAIKEKYIKDFEAYLKSLTKDELAAFCANRSTQENSSSDEDDSDSDHAQEESSNESSDSSESDNESDEN